MKSVPFLMRRALPLAFDPRSRSRLMMGEPLEHCRRTVPVACCTPDPTVLYAPNATSLVDWMRQFPDTIAVTLTVPVTEAAHGCPESASIAPRRTPRKARVSMSRQDAGTDSG